MRRRLPVAAVLAVVAAFLPTAAHAEHERPRAVLAPQRCSAPPLPPPDGPLVVDPDSESAPAGRSWPVVDRAPHRRVVSGVRNFVACINAGDHLRAAPLLTAHFVRNFMGQTSYRQVPEVLGGLRIERLRIGEMRQYADGSFTTELTYLAYGHQLARARMTWWPDRADGFLKLNRLDALSSPVPHTAEEVRVEMGEYFFRVDRTVIRAPHGKVVLRLRNVGEERHEAILLRLPEGAVGADLFNDRLSQEDVVTIAQENGGSELSLVNLAPGVYTLVDFIPAPDGRPHGEHGQTAQFTVVR